MRFTTFPSLIILLTTLFTTSTALQALASSPCAVKCGNVLSETRGVDDISCTDSDYGTIPKANIFQSCINCQLASKYVDPTTKQTDLQWALYNLRYAVSWCLFGYPNNTDHGVTPCMTRTACGTLENAFEFDSLSPNATAYGYCALMHDDVIPKCTACVSQSDEFFVTNYITTLNAACKQQPIAGATVSIDGNLFSHVPVNITDPNTVMASDPTHQSGGLPLGAKVGIAVGALVVFLLVLGCCIVWRGKKRRRQVIAARQRQSGYAQWVQSQVTQNRASSLHFGHLGTPRSPQPGQFFDSPQSAKPLFPDPSWGRGLRDEESPMSAHPGEKTFSPYSSNYNSPISAHDQVQVIGREWPMDRQASYANGGGGASLGRPPARSRSREKKDREGDRIEMQTVAPVLLHPGSGRG